MKPAVSVIVPVYKVEPYLVRCLESLQKQSLKNIEIILVDDASPDRCGEMCEQYAVKDTRFKVIHHTKNKGLAAARNTGIQQATADYLMFVDSDDYVHENFCKIPYECALNNKVDLVLFHWQRILESVEFKNKNISLNSYSQYHGYITSSEATDLLFDGIGEYAWNKLYRKELFDTVSYPDGYLFEDMGTTYKTIWRSSRIYILDEILYYYRYRNNSILTLNTLKNLHDKIEMSMQEYHDLISWGYSVEKLNYFLTTRALEYCIKIKPDVSDMLYAFCANILLNSKIQPKMLTRKRKVLLLLFKHCRPLFNLTCSLYGTKVC